MRVGSTERMKNNNANRDFDFLLASYKYNFEMYSPVGQ